MPIVRGCNLPDDLLYDVDNHTWYSELGDGTVRMGMTAVATALAGELVAFTPKKIGREVKAGKSCATIESVRRAAPPMAKSSPSTLRWSINPISRTMIPTSSAG